MIPPEQITELWQKYTSHSVDPQTMADVRMMLLEIERLYAARPFCAKCKWAGARRGGTVWCNRINTSVKAGEVDGICLCEEK